jgi:hypothetical protein
MKVEIKNKSKTYKKLKQKLQIKKLGLIFKYSPLREDCYLEILNVKHKFQGRREKREINKKKECQRQSR